ncbi:DUF6204 family protein [Streptomyces sp. NPDC091377]|uniref:DUF6204 family protein n=1 Tax=Streptomyces sp. NPDC091377 TaxID=3365995 RepID=UPI0037FC4EA1
MTTERHTYRVIVRGTWDGLTEQARARRVDRAEGALRALGLGFTGLRSTVTDLDTMNINRKGASRR